MKKIFLFNIRGKLFNFCVNGIVSGFLFPKRMRLRIYQYFGLDIQTDQIMPKVFIGSSNIRIGKGSFINTLCFFDGNSRIDIGTNVFIGMRSLLITSNHNIGSELCRATDGQSLPIIIEDGCWIGANVTILPGVTIERGCVIAAGSVVTKNCEKNCLYGGNPAKKIRYL